MKKTTVRVLSALLVIVIVFSSLMVNSFALDFIGSGTGNTGGGSTSASGGYTLKSTDNCQGYRISYVDRNGNTKSIIDIINANEQSNYKSNGRKRLKTKLSKKELIGLYNNGSNFSIATENTSTGGITYVSTGFSFLSSAPLKYSFKTMASDLDTWQRQAQNLNKVLTKMNASYSVANMSPGDMILIEPIVLCKFNNTDYAVTMTELWCMAGSMFGYGTKAKFGGNDGTYNKIAYRLNGTFPNSLYTTNGKGLWGNASKLTVPSTADGSVGPAFSTLITKGYGAAIAYTDTKPAKLLTIYYDCYGSSVTANSPTTFYLGDYNRVCSNTESKTQSFMGTDKLLYHTVEAGKQLGGTGLWNFSSFKFSAPTGYKFAGWKANGRIFGEDDPTIRAEDLNPNVQNGSTYVFMTAQFEKNQYTATFDANGGSEAVPRTITKDYGTALGALPTTSRSGYTFDGWYTAQTGGSRISSTTTMPAYNVTYYAHWTKTSVTTYTATFDANGGTTAVPRTIVKTPGTALGTLPTTTRTGYTFNGWYTSSTSGTKISSSTTMPSRNVTYYAHWTPNKLTICYDCYGSTATINTSKGYKYDGTYNRICSTTYTNKTIAGSPNVYYETLEYGKTVGTGGLHDFVDFGLTAPSGKKFVGWKANGRIFNETTTTYTATDFTSDIGNGDTYVWLSAQFEDNQYTATFDANGGTTASPRTIVRTPGTALGTLPTTTRTGYTFDGWYTSSTSGTKISSSTTMPSRNVTYYAHWTPNKLTICYDCYGSTATINTSKGYKYDGTYNRICSTTYTNKTIAGSPNVYYETLEYGKTVGTGGLHDFVDFGLTAPSGKKFVGWKANGRIFDETTTTYTASDFTSDIGNGDTYVWLTAQFENNPYTATFDANGGSTASPRTITKPAGTALGTLPTTSRSGYTFLGWYTSASGGTSISNTTPMPPYNVTYYAHWQENVLPTYKVTYDANGGSNAPGQQIKTQGVDLTLSSQIPTRDGYIFTEWNTKKTGLFGKDYNPSDKYTEDEDVTLYAQWKKGQASYTVTYNANGGSNAPASQTKTHGVDLTLSAQKPTRAGYTFSHWCTNQDGDTGFLGLSGKNYDPSDKYTKNESVTLYAQWTPNSYTIAFNGNGSTGGSTASMSMTFDVAANLTANGFTRTGYTFNGWNTNSSGTGTNYSNQQSVKNLTTVNGATVTLYAKWIKNEVSYTATFDANGGSEAVPRTITRTEGTALGTLPTTTRTGYTFDGWYTSATGGSKISSRTPMPAYNVTYYAHWTPNSYTIAFDGNGSTGGSTASMSMTFDVAKNLTANGFTRTGYTFNGWNTNSSGTGTNYTNQQSVKNLTTVNGATVTLYAKWTKNAVSYTATFDANGGSEAVPRTITRTEGTALGTLPTTTRTGYTFDGWYTSATGGSKISSRTTMPAYNVTYYAHWTPYELTICYDCYNSSATINTSKGYKFDTAGNKRVCTTTYTNKEVAGTPNVYYHTLKYGQQIGGTGLQNFADFGLTAPIGYKFTGWKSGDNGKIFNETTTTYTAADFTNDIKEGDTYVWLTAQFEPIKYTIVFNGNGSTGGSTASMSMTYDVAKNLTANGFTRTGYKFNGWNTNSSGTGTNYTNQQSVKNLTTVNGATVTLYAKWTKNTPNLELQPIAANAPYRENTEVITSFYIINNASVDCIPSNNISVQFTVTKSDNSVLKSYTKSQVVVPKNDYNLIYFKWKVPTGLNGQSIKISGEIIEGGTIYGRKTASYTTTKYTTSTTPNTQYEEKAPAGFSIVTPPATKNQAAKWEEWTYSSGKFVKKNYGISITGYSAAIEPKTGSTHQYKNDMWYMKSGYGISLSLSNGTSTPSGCTTPPTAAYTAPQYAFALLPEYKYSTSASKYQTLSLSSGKWVFPNTHYIPLWYPDGRYIVSVTQSDMWTPNGMLKRVSNANEIRIAGSAYDDWYVGR